MNDYRLQKKRDGQGWINDGDIYASSFAAAKIKFAEHVFNDLLNGVHGDNYTLLTKEEDAVEEDGIYYNGDLEFSNDELKEGIEGYSNDVYMWKLQNIYTVKIDGTQEDSAYADSLEEAIKEFKEVYGTENVVLISE